MDSGLHFSILFIKACLNTAQPPAQPQTMWAKMVASLPGKPSTERRPRSSLLSLSFPHCLRRIIVATNLKPMTPPCWRILPPLCWNGTQLVPPVDIYAVQSAQIPDPDRPDPTLRDFLSAVTHPVKAHRKKLKSPSSVRICRSCGTAQQN